MTTIIEAAAAAPDRIVREAERKNITGTGRTTWWEMEKRGEAPLRVELVGGRVGWRLSELLAWVASRQPRAGKPEAA
jgi:predicted DNA-binding transcriptional regulator AlpA